MRGPPNEGRICKQSDVAGSVCHLLSRDSSSRVAVGSKGGESLHGEGPCHLGGGGDGGGETNHEVATRAGDCCGNVVEGTSDAPEVGFVKRFGCNGSVYEDAVIESQSSNAVKDLIYARST